MNAFAAICCFHVSLNDLWRCYDILIIADINIVINSHRGFPFGSVPASHGACDGYGHISSGQVGMHPTGR